MTDGHDAAGERLLDVDGIRLCVEVFGGRGDPPILLIAGMAASMDFWDTDLCRRLAAGGRFVVRYDHRDTGRSTNYPPGEPAYTGLDLAGDALRVLDGLDLASAHIVGISMGGGIAQRLAIEHPDRVETLALIATTAVSDVDHSTLPSPEPRIQETLEGPPEDPDWSDGPAVVAFLLEGERPYAGSIPLDEARIIAVAETVVDRTTNVQSAMTNHWTVEDGPPLSGSLRDVTAPTLVVHGTADPLFPLPHGEALAAVIPGAALLPVPGMGHQVPPPPTWDLVLPAILRHTLSPH